MRNILLTTSVRTIVCLLLLLGNASPTHNEAYQRDLDRMKKQKKTPQVMPNLSARYHQLNPTQQERARLFMGISKDDPRIQSKSQNCF